LRIFEFDELATDAMQFSDGCRGLSEFGIIHMRQHYKRDET